MLVSSHESSQKIPFESMVMSTVAMNPSAAPAFDLSASLSGNSVAAEVVEIGLLLPTDWAIALVELAKKRQQSVGELLRVYIGRALHENEAHM
jgi:hypothetical protein